MKMNLKVRFLNHKLSMITNKKTCGVAIRYNKITHKLDDFEFVVIEQINSNNNNVHNVDVAYSVIYTPTFWLKQKSRI